MPKVKALVVKGHRTRLCKPRSIHWFRAAKVRARAKAARARFE